MFPHSILPGVKAVNDESVTRIITERLQLSIKGQVNKIFLRAKQTNPLKEISVAS